VLVEFLPRWLATARRWSTGRTTGGSVGSLMVGAVDGFAAN